MFEVVNDLAEFKVIQLENWFDTEDPDLETMLETL